MKILFIPWDSVGQDDLEDAFIQEGHTLVYSTVFLEKKTYSDLPEVEARLSGILDNENPDIVFTVNYYPMISDFCHRHKIRYISWIYDSHFRRIYSKTVINPCNAIYILDKQLYLEFREAGVSTVRYLPMAANVERLDTLHTKQSDFAYDVSFVGSLYLETLQPFTKMSESLSDYAKGYLDALVASQLKIQGYDFIPDVLGPIMEEMRKAYPISHEPWSIESDEDYYAQHVINRWITTVERVDLLDAVAQKFGVDFFTHYKIFTLPNLRNHGPAGYMTEMPLVFKQSKVNLNISRRGMKGGIPLRAFDIMGSGGFLLSNFQSDFLDLFVPGEDFVYYESKEDMLDKIGYYLSHEDQRQAIAKNGHDKVAAAHTYRHRVREMLSGI